MSKEKSIGKALEKENWVCYIQSFLRFKNREAKEYYKKEEFYKLIIKDKSHISDGGSSGPSSTSGGRASSSEPTYMMEHLATFTVTKETGIVYPADGMRRLLQLEKSNGIWSQKMQLRLERNWVLIMDNETGVIFTSFLHSCNHVLSCKYTKHPENMSAEHCDAYILSHFRVSI